MLILNPDPTLTQYSSRWTPQGKSESCLSSLTESGVHLVPELFPKC